MQFSTRIVAVFAIAIIAVLGVSAAVALMPAADDKPQQASEANGDAPELTQASDTEATSEPSQSTDDASLSERDKSLALQPGNPPNNTAGNGRKVVYLTIDDGPSELTPQVLDVLDKYDCKATFFVTGHDPDYYHLIKEAYDRGHTIGLHTMTHDYAQLYSSVDAFFSDLDQIGQVVKDQIGYVPCFTRFPGGSSNSISSNYSPGIMTTLVDAVQERGYQYYDWNASSGDGSNHTADELFEFSIEGNPPGEYEENIVLLCHDSATKQTTVDALPRIIEFYQKMGYSFEAIDRDSWVPHHGVGN